MTTPDRKSLESKFKDRFKVDIQGGSDNGSPTMEVQLYYVPDPTNPFLTSVSDYFLQWKFSYIPFRIQRFHCLLG
jgi:hypothetical protein